MKVSAPRLGKACAVACAFTMLPLGVVDAKPEKKKPEVAARKIVDRKKSPEIIKIEAWNKKLKTAVKDGIITEREALIKLAAFKKKVFEQKRAAKKALSNEKKRAAQKRAQKKAEQTKKPAPKKIDKKKPDPATLREYTRKVRKDVRAGKLTRAEGRAKIVAYRKKMGWKNKDRRKPDRNKKQK